MTMRLREWELSEIAPDVQIAPGAAYWSVESRANAPFAGVFFSQNSLGEFLYHTIVPKNISATPSLSYVIYCAANSSATSTNYLLYTKSLLVQSGQATSPSSTSWLQSTTTSFAANGAAYQQAQYVIPNSMGILANSLLKVAFGRNAASAGDNVSQLLQVEKVTALAYIDDTL